MMRIMKRIISATLPLIIIITVSHDLLAQTDHQFDLSVISGTSDTNDPVYLFNKTGYEILESGSIKPVDSILLYRFIDSILTTNPVNRKFYLSIFNQIQKEAYGEIQVYMGWNMLTFARRYPDDFFSMSDAEIDYYARVIGLEFATEEEFPYEAADKFIDDMAVFTDKKYSGRLKDFERKIHAEIKKQF